MAFVCFNCSFVKFAFAISFHIFLFLTIQVEGCLSVFSFKVGFKRIERTSGTVCDTCRLQTADYRLHLGLNSTLVSLNSTQVSLNSTQVSLFTVSYW